MENEGHHGLDLKIASQVPLAPPESPESDRKSWAEEEKHIEEMAKDLTGSS